MNRAASGLAQICVIRPLVVLALWIVTAATCIERSACAEEVLKPAFRTEIKAPSALEGPLKNNLELVRWERYDAVSDELLEQLVEQARIQAAEILATHGYFSPRVTTTIAQDKGERVVHMEVEAGDPTRVRAVHIALTSATTDIHLQARLAAVRAAWSLRAGDVFTQAGWEAAKRAGVTTLARERYAAAAVASSKATIDPEAQAADLEAIFEPGPEFVFGAAEIVGLQKYPEAAVRNLQPFVEGAPYSREKLDDWQRRLTATNYFASVQINVEPDPERPGPLPVKVKLIEAPQHKIDVGVGYSTDALWRAQFDYRDVAFFGTEHRMTSTLRYESKEQSASVALDAPPRADGWLDSYGVKVEAEQNEGLDTVATTVGVRRRKADERDQPAVGLSYIVEREKAAGSPPANNYALVATYRYTWRRTDDLLSPRTGWNATVETGVALPGVSSRPFVRPLAKWNYFQPLARRIDATLRLEGGAVLATGVDGIPQAMLFRTGGDTTVRGYSFESIGVQRGAATVGGRYYTLASAESIYWMREALGFAAFVDAGDAFDQRSDAKLKLGYGLGARVRTPAGPLRLDIAYGRDVHEFRIHFSFGLTF
jgi:translocation and assembly module TamA